MDLVTATMNCISSGKGSLSEIMLSANLTSQQMKEIIIHLTSRGLIEETALPKSEQFYRHRKAYRLTEKGHKVLHAAKQLSEFVKRPSELVSDARHM